MAEQPSQPVGADQQRDSSARSSYDIHARHSDEAEPSLDSREGVELPDFNTNRLDLPEVLPMLDGELDPGMDGEEERDKSRSAQRRIMRKRSSR